MCGWGGWSLDESLEGSLVLLGALLERNLDDTLDGSLDKFLD